MTCEQSRTSAPAPDQGWICHNCGGARYSGLTHHCGTIGPVRFVQDSNTPPIRFTAFVVGDGLSCPLDCDACHPVCPGLRGHGCSPWNHIRATVVQVGESSMIVGPGMVLPANAHGFAVLDRRLAAVDQEG